MTDLCERDWEALNAYLDGELPGPERRAFARRLAREPDLSAAADELRAQSGSLRRMGPAPGGRRPARRRASALGGAVAAGLAVAAFLAVPGTGPESDLAAIHETFLEQRFPARGGPFADADLARSGPLPDLSPAGLALVAVRDVDGGVAGHYAGRNACRLTLVTRKAGAAPGPGAPEVWVVGGRRYAVLSDGMDPGRLAAIETYLRAVTDPAGGEVDRLAVARQVSRTETCA